MNFKMFIEFPGILITIGVLFLIPSIILDIIAYKKSDIIVAEEEKEERPSEFFNSNESVHEEVTVDEPITMERIVIEAPEEVVTETIDTPNTTGSYEYSFAADDASFKNMNEVEEEEIELL